MYRRPRHQLIAEILRSLDAELFATHNCYFGGGTAIAMSYGEYRTSDDIDFLVSDMGSYKELRNLAKQGGLANFFSSNAQENFIFSQARTDQYGIRGSIGFLDLNIKFEIIQEGRVQLNLPGEGEKVEGVSRLGEVDLVAEKLLANSDRWADTAVRNRDVLDLAFMGLSKIETHQGFQKATEGYGKAIKIDLEKAIATLVENPSYLELCLASLEIDESEVAVVTRLRKLL